MPDKQPDWSTIANAAKASAPAPASASATSASPDTVGRIVAAARHHRHQWILDAWRSSAIRATAVGAAAIAVAALVFWVRHQPAPEPPLMPLPALEQFPDAPIKP